MKRRTTLAPVIVTAIVAFSLCVAAPSHVTAQTTTTATVAASTSQGLTAIEEAAKGGKYLFVFFWKDNGEQTRNMRKVFETATAKWTDSAAAISISATDPNEKPLVDKFDIGRAPMPLVLALAPNGAITRGFPMRFTEEQLETAFVSACTEQCMKALQDRKLVLLCVQNQRTESAEAALQGARDFQADARYAKTTEIVVLDPEDRVEASLLQGLSIDPRTAQAVTVILSPPGKPVATLAGAVTKEQIVAKLTAPQSSCCPGGKCEPSGR